MRYFHIAIILSAFFFTAAYCEEYTGKVVSLRCHTGTQPAEPPSTGWDGTCRMQIDIGSNTMKYAWVPNLDKGIQPLLLLSLSQGNPLTFEVHDSYGAKYTNYKLISEVAITGN